MNPQSAAFPAPSSLQVLAGTERAQAAYPYYMQFTAADDARFWFYNSMHFPEPMSAFDMVTAEAAYCALGSSTTRVHCIPTTLGDRKSTRLNSSHSQISYAVFCLKKKNTRNSTLPH